MRPPSTSDRRRSWDPHLKNSGPGLRLKNLLRHHPDNPPQSSRFGQLTGWSGRSSSTCTSTSISEFEHLRAKITTTFGGDQQCRVLASVFEPLQPLCRNDVLPHGTQNPRYKARRFDSGTGKPGITILDSSCNHVLACMSLATGLLIRRFSFKAHWESPM